MVEVVAAVVVFTVIVVTLSGLILLARSRLTESGTVVLVVNEDRRYEVATGRKLLSTLAEVGLYLPAACGGKGTCGQCRVAVLEGGGPLLPTEAGLVSPREANNHVRLGCQVSVREDLRVRVPDELFGVRSWECTVRSTRGVSTYIKELVFELPTGEEMPFKAGGYVQVECPRYRASFADFDIEPEYRVEWDRRNLWRLEAVATEPTTRAYSMANYPGEKGIIMLDVGIATPPPGADDRVPPGVVSSYLFSLRDGDRVVLTGPYGEFFAKDTEREMVFIGGGTGMAPLRSHILDQLKRIGTNRRISFWFGVRSVRDLFYVDEFEALAAEHDNFSYTVSLSEPDPNDDWTGAVGFIHQVAFDRYLSDHPAPEDCEYYLCGPPLMIAAVTEMLRDLGVSEDDIMFDDFGG
ncbi:MAG: NADH:ubiquinone reductase (Na(+)-transporting) subunit F [Myxococcota bacterium]